MAFELVWEPDGVIKQFSGQVSAREFINAVERVQSDSRFDEARYIINDFSAMTGHELSDEILTEAGVLQYGAHVSNPNCRIVYVTADEGLIALLRLNLATTTIDSYQTEIQPTLADARDWLDSQPQLHLMSNVMGFRIN